MKRFKKKKKSSLGRSEREKERVKQSLAELEQDENSPFNLYKDDVKRESVRGSKTEASTGTHLPVPKKMKLMGKAKVNGKLSQAEREPFLRSSRG